MINLLCECGDTSAMHGVTLFDQGCIRAACHYRGFKQMTVEKPEIEIEVPAQAEKIQGESDGESKDSSGG